MCLGEGAVYMEGHYSDSILPYINVYKERLMMGLDNMGDEMHAGQY